MDSSNKDKGVWPSDKLPSNWAWAPMDLVFNNETSSDRKLKQKMYLPEGRIAVIDQGQELVGGYTNDDNIAFTGELPVIIFGDHTRCVKYIDFPFAQGADGVKVLSPTSLVDPKFSYNSLLTLSLPDKGYSRHFKFLKETQFPIPPLPEQKRIAKKIDALQARSSGARKALEAVPSLLEKFRQSVLSSAFRGDLTADWRAQNSDIEPAEKLLERIRKERRKRWEEDELAKMKAKGKTPKDDKWKKKYKEPEPVDTTDLPKLPEGWCWATLSELSSAINPIGYGVLQPGNEVEDGARLVRVCDLEDGKVLTEQLRTISSEVDNQYIRTRLKGRELLVTVVGTIGRVAIAPNEIAGANVARAVARLTPTDPISASWLLRMLSSSFLQDWLVKGAREVARKTLNIGVLGKTPVPLCSVNEMQEGLDKVDKLLFCISPLKKMAQKNLNYILSLDQSILAKAFRGELVPQDPNDEPAFQLLKRIKQEKASLEPGKKKRARRGRTEKNYSKRN